MLHYRTKNEGVELRGTGVLFTPVATGRNALGLAGIALILTGSWEG